MTDSSAPGPKYRDVREYLDELDRRGLLRRVSRTTNKDTEVMPLVRWQFRGQDAEQRHRHRQRGRHLLGLVVPLHLHGDQHMAAHRARELVTGGSP